MYKTYILVLCCFIPALVAADKQEKKYKDIIAELDLDTSQLLQKTPLRKNSTPHEHDIKHTSGFVKEIARAYRELKGKCKEEEKRNLELEAIVLRLNEQLAQRNIGTEQYQDSSASTSSSTSPTTDIASSPSLMATILQLNEDDDQKEASSQSGYVHGYQLPIVKKLPSDRYDINYHKDYRALGTIPF